MSCYAGLWDELSDNAWSIKWPCSNLQDRIPVSGQKVISQSNDSLVDNPWGACSSPVFLKDLKIGNLTKCSLGIPFFQGLLQLELAFDSFDGDCWSSSLSWTCPYCHGCRNSAYPCWKRNPACCSLGRPNRSGISSCRTRD
jgi:hypothetical protein